MPKTLLAILAKHAPLLLGFVLVQAIGSIAGAIEPLYMQKILSALIAWTDSGGQGALFGLFGTLALLYLISISGQGGGAYIMTRLSAEIFKEVRQAFFSKISRLPLAFFRRENQGELVAKFNLDLGNTERLLTDTVPRFSFHLLAMVVVLVILFRYCNTFLTLVVIGIALLSSALLVRLNRKLGRLAEGLRQSYADTNRIFDETVQGIDTLKLFAGEAQQVRKFDATTSTFRSLSLTSGKISAVYSSLIFAVTQYGNLLVLLLGYIFLTRQTLTLDMFLLYFFYLVFFQKSLSYIVSECLNFQPTLVSLKKINQLFQEQDELPEMSETSDAVLPDRLKVEIENLSFAYPNGKTVFQDIDITIEARRTTLISGPSGSGKTTLINLMLGFYQPSGGRILVNGRGIETYGLQDLRRGISVVTQDYFIFEESLRTNLALAKPQASEAQMVEALKKAHLGDWYQALSAGLETSLGSRGKTMSAGERQRICIARAFLKQAPLLILDEPFANIDERAKEEILQVIAGLRHELTLVIISHQPIAAEFFDRSYVLGHLTATLS